LSVRDCIALKTRFHEGALNQYGKGTPLFAGFVLGNKTAFGSKRAVLLDICAAATYCSTVLSLIKPPFIENALPSPMFDSAPIRALL
jgi:hypothetical protein